MFAGVFVPTRWLEAWHAWLGLGSMPDDALLQYALRGGAYVQGCLGVLMWVIVRDVVRHRPLVIAIGVIYLASGPAFLVLNAAVGMPKFWALFDGVSCTILGAALLAAASERK
jgi:hypothetical protein